MVVAEALDIETDVPLTPAKVDLLRDALVAYQAATTRHRMQGVISESEHFERINAATALAAELREATP